jgi:solute carrier family 13 (sodium-dependent dicarboxylate transporter), member 2/3/5
MMFPIALSVVQVIKENHPHQKGFANFSVSVMIAIALASNFGGIATIIGTPPNVAYVAFINKKYNYAVSFFDWMIICMPLAIVLLFSLYLVMVKWLYPNRMKSDNSTKEIIHSQVTQLGKFSVAEKRVLVVFASTALLWMTKDLLNETLPFRLDDNMIALIGATALFITPSGTEKQALLAWDDTKKMAWGILLLFGGGIALAGALEKAGLIEQLGAWFAQFAFNRLMLIFLVTLISLFLSEVMSNVAQVIVFAPVVSSLADASGMHPLLLGIPMTLAASCASMLPMGTPPNAIAFSSGYIKLRQMTRVGFAMNLVSVALITVFCWLLLPLIFKI